MKDVPRVRSLAFLLFFFGGGLGLIFDFQTTGIIMRRLGRIGQCRSMLRRYGGVIFPGNYRVGLAI